MTEEQTEQSNEPVQENDEVQSNEPEETIGDIAKRYNVEEQAQSFRAESQPVSEISPDPYLDPDGYQQHQFQQTAKATQNLMNEVNTVKQQLEQQRLDQDVKQAVAKLDVDVDEDFKEVYLEREYRVNPDFKKIWDSRYQNPKALDAALKIIGNQMSKKTSMKTDHQLVENQQAAKKSQRTMASAPPEDSMEDKLMNMGDHEFDAMWNQMRGRG